MPINRIGSANAKVERAKKHVEDLELEVRAFLNLGPYYTLGYDDRGTGDRVIRFHALPVPSTAIALIVSDAIQNLRSSLDHIAWQLSHKCGGQPNHRTSFPIFKKIPPDIEAEIARRIPAASSEIISLIKLLEPYQGGKSDILWRLSQLNIIDKHRLLITVGTCSWAVDILGDIPPHGFLKNVALEDGDEIVRVKAAERTANYKDPRFHFQVAFGEVIEGTPVVHVLEDFVDAVSRVIDAFSPLLR
jgi:hypothetical protein